MVSVAILAQAETRVLPRAMDSMDSSPPEIPPRDAAAQDAAQAAQAVAEEEAKEKERVESEKERAKQEREAADAVAAPAKLSLRQKFATFVVKDSSAARNVRGAVYEVANTLKPELHPFVTTTIRLANVRSDSFSFEEADLPTGQPLIGDVNKQLTRRGGPPRAEQMLLLIKNQAEGYSVSGRGCSFSTLVAYAVSLARFSSVWVGQNPDQPALGEGYLPPELLNVWTVGVGWLQMVSNANYWRSQLAAANADWFHSSGFPEHANERIFFNPV